MTAATGEPAPSDTARQWHAFFHALGSIADDIPVRGGRRAVAGSDGRDQHIRLREVFIQADSERRRSLDLLCVALLERRSEGYRQDRLAEVVVLSTETVRGHTVAVPSGLLAVDLPLGRGGGDLRSASLVVFAVERRPYVLDIVDSIEGLGQVLDYEHDPEGSTAVGEAIVRRVDSLVSTPGVAVLVAGEVSRFAYRPEEDACHLLVPGGAHASEMGGLRVDDDGRVVIQRPDGSRDPWQEHDFVLIGFGRLPSRRPEFRSLRELRQEQALANIGLEPGTVTDEESWTARAARARQAARAQQIVLRAIAGDAEAAWELFRLATHEPDPDALIEGLVTRVRTPREFWLIDTALGAPRNDLTVGENEITWRAQTLLIDQLEQFLGLPARDTNDPAYMPITTPIVVEVGNTLASIVQSKPDGRDFIEESLPEMRAAILKSTGVDVPGVRVRPNEGFAPNHFQVQIYEVPVVDGDIALDGRYRWQPYIKGTGDRAGEITNIEPRTGKPGTWLLVASDGGAPDDDGDDGAPDDDGDGDAREDELTSAAYLIHRIDVTLRSQLARFAGPQETDAILDRWRERGEEKLIAETVPDRRARLRLTWLLQALVGEAVPVTDIPAILGAVKDAGGIGEATQVLVRRVRWVLRDRLPGPREPEWRVTVPPELETAVLTGNSPEHLPPLTLVQWLRHAVGVFGPVISVVATTPEARERIAVFARLEHPFVATFSVDELGPVP